MNSGDLFPPRRNCSTGWPKHLAKAGRPLCAQGACCCHIAVAKSLDYKVLSLQDIFAPRRSGKSSPGDSDRVAWRASYSAFSESAAAERNRLSRRDADTTASAIAGALLASPISRNIQLAWRVRRGLGSRCTRNHSASSPALEVLAEHPFSRSCQQLEYNLSISCSWTASLSQSSIALK